MNDCEQFDTAQLNEMRAIAGEGFALLVDQFEANAAAQLQALRAAAQSRDALAFKRAAHKLKGTSATLGAIQLAAHCQALEQMGARGDLGDATAQLAALASCATAAIAALRCLTSA